MGSNQDGKLGVADKSIQSSNVPCLVDGLENIVKVSCGLGHSLALNEEGSVFAWGQSFYGALGLGDICGESLYRPEQVSEVNDYVIDIAAGSRHSLLLTQDQCFSCGDAKSGQLGLSDAQLKQQERVLFPTSIQALKNRPLKAVSCGKFHSLFLTEQGEVFACGGNSFGQLGTGSKQMLREPQKLERLKHVKQISAWHFSAAVTESDQLFVWGTGIFGESLLPRLVESPNLAGIASIQVGGSFSVIVDSQNKAYAWGANTNGELGTGDSQPRIQPQLIEALEDKAVGLVGVGSAFAFALGLKQGLTSSQITLDENQQSQAAVNKDLMKMSSYNLESSIPEVRVEEEEDDLALSRKSTIDRLQMKDGEYNHQVEETLRADIKQLLEDNHHLQLELLKATKIIVSRDE